MLVIIAASTFALALIIVVRSHKPDSSSLTEPRATILTIGVQIICGDCSGDDVRPFKTYLDCNGKCSQCGGRSYMLASNRIWHAQQIVKTRLLEDQSIPGNGSIELIESSLSPHRTQVHRVTA